MDELDTNYRSGIRPRAVDQVIAMLAGRQYGVVSRWQLLAAGIDATAIDYRVRAGRLLVVHQGVYAVAHRALRREAWWLAAALAGGPRALTSHISGAGVLGLLRDNGTRTHITVPQGTHRVAGIVMHRSRTLEPQDALVHDGIPVTSVARTLLDVAATRRDLVPRAVAQAEVLRVFDLRAVQDVVGRNRGHRGAKSLLAAIDDHLPGTELSDSVLADMFLELLRRAGVSRPEREQYVEDYRVDFLWRTAKVVVETDGWGSHGTPTAFQNDRERDRTLQFAGYVVIRVTRRDARSGATDILVRLKQLIADRTPTARGRTRRQ